MSKLSMSNFQTLRHDTARIIGQFEIFCCDLCVCYNLAVKIDEFWRFRRLKIKHSANKNKFMCGLWKLRKCLQVTF